jgi:hypothetical protein
MNADEIEKFLHDGWVIVNIPQPGIIHEYAAILEAKTREITGTDCRLADIHKHVDDEAFKALHAALSEYFWKSEFSIRASVAFLPILKEIIGLDVMVQYMPYLRLARPEKMRDNIGFHRDTQYGQTPYELAVHIPFVDLDENAALRIISGSHRLAESAFPIVSSGDSEVVKGSIEHRIGKPYAPKRMVIPDGARTEPLSMRVGQAALFSPALFHGQEINSGNGTRVSTDMRFVSKTANVDIRIGKVHAGYVPVSCSPIQQLAQEYYQAQQAIA